MVVDPLPVGGEIVQYLLDHQMMVLFLAVVGVLALSREIV
jgi:hypothetical protein